MEKKEYTNGEVTVVWKPGLCIHSANCVNGLPRVFKPNEKPWINTDAASTKQLIAQIKKCPSAALSYYLNADKSTNQKAEITASSPKIEAITNGPLLVSGEMVLKVNGQEQTIKNAALCRCGASGNKPLCDGTHKKVDFKS